MKSMLLHFKFGLMPNLEINLSTIAALCRSVLTKPAEISGVISNSVSETL